MSGLIGEIGADFAKGKSKAVARAKLVQPWPASQQSAEFATPWRNVLQRDAGQRRKSTDLRPSRQLARPVQTPVQFVKQQEPEPMKTFACLSAAFIVSLVLMASTVVVPLGAAQFIA
jgi:hypothetical protein